MLFGIPAALNAAFTLVGHVRALPGSSGRRLGRSDFARQGTLSSLSVSELSRPAREALSRVYRHNLASIERDKFGPDMEDLKTLALNINYGWNLSEMSVLNFASTEMVVLAALVPQNVRVEILWHLRGARRAGWSDEAVNSVRTTAIEIARRFDRRTGNVPTLAEVSEDRNE